MTSKEWIIKMRRRINTLKSGKAMQLAVTSTVGEVAERIFEDGKKSSGGRIGKYDSKTPLYAYDAESPRAVTHRGKTGKTIKGGYYASYKAYRAQQQRESNFVNLRLTNDFQSDYLNNSVSKTSTAIPKAKPIKVNNFEYLVTVSRPENVDKYLGFNEKYGDIFSLTQKELKDYQDDFHRQYKIILNG